MLYPLFFFVPPLYVVKVWLMTFSWLSLIILMYTSPFTDIYSDKVCVHVSFLCVMGGVGGCGWWGFCGRSCKWLSGFWGWLGALNCATLELCCMLYDCLTFPSRTRYLVVFSLRYVFSILYLSIDPLLSPCLLCLPARPARVFGGCVLWRLSYKSYAKSTKTPTEENNKLVTISNNCFY